MVLKTVQMQVTVVISSCLRKNDKLKMHVNPSLLDSKAGQVLQARYAF